MDDSWRDGSGSRDPAADVQERVRSEFDGMLADLVDAGREVADSWGDDAVSSAAMVSAPLEEAIRGPLCRGTLADGRRLVLTFVLFVVDRRPSRYRFLDPRPEECLDVGLR